ncbi:MAG: hypothetical protein ABW123_23390, partial [Cystobacter sp.]
MRRLGRKRLRFDQPIRRRIRAGPTQGLLHVQPQGDIGLLARQAEALRVLHDGQLGRGLLGRLQDRDLNRGDAFFGERRRIREGREPPIGGRRDIGERYLHLRRVRAGNERFGGWLGGRGRPSLREEKLPILQLSHLSELGHIRQLGDFDRAPPIRGVRGLREACPLLSPTQRILGLPCFFGLACRFGKSCLFGLKRSFGQPGVFSQPCLFCLAHLFSQPCLFRLAS